MFGIGMPELLVILVVALIVIGPTRLPEIARALGKGYGEFSRSFRQLRNEFDDVTSDFEREADFVRDPMGSVQRSVEDSFTADREKTPEKAHEDSHDKPVNPAELELRARQKNRAD